MSESVTYEMREIPIARIRAFDFQPRKWFNPEEIRARAESLKAVGQQSPVTVEHVTGDAEHDYELVDGESRLRSAIQAGLKTLWCSVRSRPFRSATDKHMASLVANFNHSEHTPMEISDALKVQVTHGGRTQANIARALGKPQIWVSKYLSLQKLHPDIQKLLHPAVHKHQRIAPAIGFELSKVPEDRQLEVMGAARGADGRVTQLRIQIEIERLSGIKRRRLSPAKRREKILNTVRAVRTDLARLQSVVGGNTAEVLQLLKEGAASEQSVVEEGIEALQSVQAMIRRQRDGAPPSPKVLDTEAMSEDERYAYMETWRLYWTSVGEPPRTRKREPLLIEIAYPKWGPASRAARALKATGS